MTISILSWNIADCTYHFLIVDTVKEITENWRSSMMFVYVIPYRHSWVRLVFVRKHSWNRDHFWVRLVFVTKLSWKRDHFWVRLTWIILRPLSALSLDEGLNTPNGKTLSAAVWFRRPIKCQILACMCISDFLYFHV